MGIVYNWSPMITGGGGEGVTLYPNFAAFPLTASNGALGLALDTDLLYAFNTTSMTWVSTSGTLSLPAFSAAYANAAGTVIGTPAEFSYGGIGGSPNNALCIGNNVNLLPTFGNFYAQQIIDNSVNGFSNNLVLMTNQAGVGSLGGGNPALTFFYGNGAQNAPTTVLTGDWLGSILFGGFGTTYYPSSACISVQVTDPTPSDTSMGNEIVFQTSPNGSFIPTTALILGNDQNATVNSALLLGISSDNTTYPLPAVPANIIATLASTQSDLSIVSANQTGVNSSNINIISGNNDSLNSGNITLQSGNTTGGTSGIINIIGGNSILGSTGGINISEGSGTSCSGIEISAGGCTTGGTQAGSVSIGGGVSSAATGIGGDITLEPGYCNSGGTAGQLYLYGGSGFTGGNGGNVNIVSGSSSATFTNGNILLNTENPSGGAFGAIICESPTVVPNGNNVTTLGSPANYWSNTYSTSFVPAYTTTVSSATPIVLTISSAQQQYITGTIAQTITLPVETTLVNGQYFRFVNISTQSATVRSSGLATVVVVPASTEAVVTVINNTITTGLAWSSISASIVSSVAAVPSTIVQRDANANVFSNNNVLGYTHIVTAGGTSTITNASGNMLAFTGAAAQTVLLPVTSTLALGWRFTVINNSTGVVTIQSSGGNTIQAMAAGSNLELVCVAVVGTGTASWFWEYYAPSQAAVALTNVVRDANANTNANNEILARQTFNNVNTAMSVTSPYTMMALGNGATTLTLPNTATLQTNQRWEIWNVGTGTVTVNTFTGATVQIMPGATSQGQSYTLIECTNTGTNVVGAWNWYYYAPSQTSVALTNVQRDVNANINVNNYIQGYDATSGLNASYALTVSSPGIIALKNTVPITITLPVTSTLQLGQQFQFTGVNNTATVTVQSSGGNTLSIMAVGSKMQVVCGSITGTGTASWFWLYQTGSGSYLNPTTQRFTTGTALTYTTPANVLYLKVTMIGAGGGGGGGGTGATGGLGGSGTASTFGTGLLNAGGALGSWNVETTQTPSAGGGYTVNAPALLVEGCIGQSGFPGNAGAANACGVSGSGGSTPIGFGGGGRTNFGAASGGSVGQSANANTGGGGAGAVVFSSTTQVVSGHGAGAGGYLVAIINSPAASYLYTVGVGGPGGPTGTSGAAGGSGGSGYIIVEEFYQ